MKQKEKWKDASGFDLCTLLVRGYITRVERFLRANERLEAIL